MNDKTKLKVTLDGKCPYWDIFNRIKNDAYSSTVEKRTVENICVDCSFNREAPNNIPFEKELDEWVKHMDKDKREMAKKVFKSLRGKG